MRPNKHLGAKAFDDVALRVELIDRVERFQFSVGIHAVDAETASPCDRQRVGLITSNECPDTLSIGIHMHGCGRSHFSSARKSCPLTSRNRRAASIRESFDRTVRIVGGSLGKAHHIRREECSDGRQHNPSSSSHLRHDTPLL